MKPHAMIGAQKRNVPGGFLTRHRKRRQPSMTEIKRTAEEFLNRRIVRGTNVHP